MTLTLNSSWVELSRVAAFTRRGRLVPDGRDRIFQRCVAVLTAPVVGAIVAALLHTGLTASPGGNDGRQTGQGCADARRITPIWDWPNRTRPLPE